MDCIDFSTNQVMRPFGAAKATRAAKPPSRPIFKAPAPPKFAMPKAQQPVGGVKLIPRGNVGVRQPTPAFPQGNPYIDRIAPRQSPATANARNAVKTPDGRLLQFFR